MPRWVRCQSEATPSLALYWHIGDTTMRLESVRSASLIGEKSALILVLRSCLVWRVCLAMTRVCVSAIIGIAAIARQASARAISLRDDAAVFPNAQAVDWAMGVKSWGWTWVKV